MFRLVKLKAFADDKINVAKKKNEISLEQYIKYCEKKGENVGTSMLSFSHYFNKLLVQSCQNSGLSVMG